ncbi:MAG: hypothetical protein PQ612_06485 [Rickettsiales bacterium]|nr:hypothetical protein [Pseudomonadota bacterium]MDA0966620.1 hypothetical protein [Pseudomonadota bacterium]MDG4543648.1 hypothetical protein [Rickettsiales bacterium]MDG4545795.1 hypothetical protein [Rickettsiales bacterium]MDG4547431.1 hypothetical protein [Rickettsiales bacterium]
MNKNNQVDKAELIKRLEPIVFEIKALNKNHIGLRELHAIQELEALKIAARLTSIIELLVDQDLTKLEKKHLN